MSKTMTKAEQEFDILEQTNKEAIVLEFKNEILALVSPESLKKIKSSLVLSKMGL